MPGDRTREVTLGLEPLPAPRAGDKGQARRPALPRRATRPVPGARRTDDRGQREPAFDIQKGAGKLHETANRKFPRLPAAGRLAADLDTELASGMGYQTGTVPGKDSQDSKNSDQGKTESLPNPG